MTLIQTIRPNFIGFHGSKKGVHYVEAETPAPVFEKSAKESKLNLDAKAWST